MCHQNQSAGEVREALLQGVKGALKGDASSNRIGFIWVYLGLFRNCHLLWFLWVGWHNWVRLVFHACAARAWVRFGSFWFVFKATSAWVPSGWSAPLGSFGISRLRGKDG